MSALRLVDQAARERIKSALGENLGVEAAAGTGKTTVLVDRVVNLLASGVVTVDELVVITFTDKAAAELSTRVRDALEVRASSADGDERERLLLAARDLYRAHIETIHSLATALLKERPVEAGIDPLFEVLQGVGAQVEFDDAYDRFQDELLAQELPELERALQRGFGLDELREACEHLNKHRYLLPLKHQPVLDSSAIIAQAAAQVREVADELRDMLVTYEPPGDDKAVPIVQDVIDWVEQFESLSDEDRERTLVAGDRAYTNQNRGSGANWGGEKRRLQALQKRYDEALDRAQDRLRSDALLGLLPHIEQFVGDYARMRKAAGRADFDDLLFWARDLLRDSKPARSYFRRRFRAVLIDEFQDTDPVQAELALILTSDAEPPGDWRNLKPASGRLMVVGDPKQSLYRFRRADIAVYDQVKDGALAVGQERISTNFRSNRQLVRALNSTFDQILTAQPGLQPANVALDSPPDAAEAKRAPIVFAEGTFEGDAQDVRKQEANVIAGLLHRARRDGWQIRDRRQENRWRTCRWGDMAILLPTRTGIEFYEDALADAGIPYRHEGSRDFYERDEVRDLIWVLAAIDDPTDRIALVGALRSSAFAISDEELLIHVADVGALSYRSKQTGPSEPVNASLAELRDLHTLRRGVSLPELVRRVVERTRLVEYALTRPDGEQGAVNLLAIVDDARLFAEAGGGGLRPFIRHLRESMEHEAIEIEATVAEETDDVVRIMTVHGAKGLEYPIVSLANLGTRSSPKRTPVPREFEAFLHFYVGTDGKSRHGHFATADYEEVWQAEKEQIGAERLRLLYVAATRARDYLLVPCVVGRLNAGHLLAELVRALPVDDEELVACVDADAIVAPSVEAAEPESVGEKQIAAAVEERSVWLIERAELKSRASREREIENASSRERAIGPLAAEVSTYGAALLLSDAPPLPVGDAVHMVMERVSLPDGEDLEQIADDVCLEGDIAHELENVNAMCRSCLDAPTVQRAIAGYQWWREVDFVVSRPNGVDPTEGPLVSGRVDLVYREGDELVVIDYKTDKDVTKKNAVKFTRKHHFGQAEVYKQALSQATGLAVKEVVFVYCRAGLEVCVRNQEILG